MCVLVIQNGDKKETRPVNSEVSSKRLSFHIVLKCMLTSLLRSDCAFVLCKVINLRINSLYMQNMLCILTAEMLLCSHLVPQGVPFRLDLALIACDHITQNKAA